MSSQPRRPSPSPSASNLRFLSLLRSSLSVVVLALVVVVMRPGIAAAQSPDASTDAAPSLGSLWATKDAWDAPEPWRTDKWYFQFAYYTWHFHYDPAHKQSYTTMLEYHTNEYWLGGQWIAGLGLFQNSFGQFSEYLYGALQWRPIAEHQPFYVKVSAGLLHGYSGQYQDKIPFNSTGTAPAIIPSMGYCWVRYCGEAVLLGANAMLFTVGVTIP